MLLLPFLVAAAPAPAADAFRDTPIEWRDYGTAAFDEAREAGRGVFLVLTAPWTWDHFLLPDRLFHSDEVVSRLNGSWIPVLADASVYPELRPLYTIRSGLLPSLHFLDADARPVGSFPPMGPEELAYYLDDYATSPNRSTLVEPPEGVAVEVLRERFTNRAARLLLDLYERKERRLPVVHADLDFADVHFFSEFGRVRLRGPSQRLVARELGLLLASDLHDDEFGFVHRSAALEDQSVVHREMTLRQNAEAGAVLAAWFRLGGQAQIGVAALRVVRSLNDFLRVGTYALYAGSLSADVYDESGRTLAMDGARYYAMNREARERIGTPVRSEDVPVGANYVWQQALLQFYRTWGDDRMSRAMIDSAVLLLEGGFEADGGARRSLGEEGIGNLRDQGDAGSGLLAVHAVSGDVAYLRAAERLADVLMDRFWDDSAGVFRNTARDSGLPEFVRSARPDVAWNGIALRFLAELGTVTGRSRWSEFVREAIEGWSRRVPLDGEGLAELGRASIRSDWPMGLVLLDAEPGSPEGDRLSKLVLRISTPLAVVRWIDRGERRSVARSFHVDLADEPAAYVVWAGSSAPCRTAREFEEAWLAAINRAW